MATFTLTCTNSSQNQFSLAFSQLLHNGEPPDTTIINWGTEPLATLLANGGQSLATVIAKMSDAELGPDQYSYVYYDSVSTWAFGIKIVVPTEVYHMGYSPYYEYCAFQSSSSPTEQTVPWVKCTGSQTVGPTSFGGFNVTIIGAVNGQDESTTLQIGGFGGAT